MTVISVSPSDDLQAAADSAEPGDILELQHGDYTQSVTLEVEGVILKSAPRSRVFFRGASISVKADLVQVLDVSLIGTGSGTGIDVGRAMALSNCVFKDLYLEKWNMGVSLRGIDHLFSNIEIKSPFQYSTSDDADYMRIYGKDHVVKNCFFHGARRAELGRSHTDCIQSLATRAGELSGQGNILFENNVFCDSVQGFMFEASSAIPMYGLRLEGNLFINQTAHGVAFKSFSGARIVNNLFYGPDASFGVRAGGGPITGTVDLLVTKNVFVGQGTAIADNNTETVNGRGNMLWNTRGEARTLGNFHEDPLMTDPERIRGTLAHDGIDYFKDIIIEAFRFQAGSPAVANGIGPSMLFPSTEKPPVEPPPVEPPVDPPQLPEGTVLKEGDVVFMNNRRYVVKQQHVLVLDPLRLASGADFLDPVMNR